jgi:hypothetical protein
MPYKKLPILLVIAAIVVASSLLAMFLLSSPSYRPGIELNPTPMVDFKLTDQYGREIRLSDVKGKPVFLFFGYTNCQTFTLLYSISGDTPFCSLAHRLTGLHSHLLQRILGVTLQMCLRVE